MHTPEVIPDSLSDLKYPEQLTLWSVRYWSDGLRQSFSPYTTLQEAYWRAKCPRVLISLDSFLSIMVAGYSRPVDIRCLCCSGISKDEWRILQSLVAAQLGEEAEIAPLISHFLEPATVRIAKPSILEWAQGLKDSGLILPTRPEVARKSKPNFARTGKVVSLRDYSNSHKSTLH
ncbi:hypothetical protein [Sneathiella sp.]|uniref:hypothetical protein n=1 Tax=Sneathiella sp. TaxID=1964365 RepID=UPI002612661B|nr:hypothetical protein [Sneathiella sp.]MDF2368209.1 hypothetical protein [Sneathiella sp.]